MAKFTDCLGREWTLRLTLGHEDDLKGLGLNTADFGKAVADLALLHEPASLAHICHLLTVEPVEAREYVKGFDPAALEAAADALLECVVDFFHSRQPRTAAAMKAKFREVVGATDAKAAVAVATLSAPDGSSPGSSAGSTPAP